MGKWVVGAAAFLFFLTGSAFAQSDRGTITGTVNDSSGAVLPGVNVTATNTETGTRYDTVSTETGNYTLVQVPVGTYELTVELPGFKRYVQQGIRVLVAQTLRVDVSLQVGANTEEITVNADASLLKTEGGEISHTIAANRLIDLGLLGIGGTYSSSQGLRFYQTEIQLIPGASVPAAGFTAGVRVNGAPNGTQRTQIDGMDSTNGINAVQAGTGISVDAMQETAIQTSNFAPEFGAVGGGLFNITTRSGGNRFHGVGYDYLANEAFNAATPFTATPTTNNVRPRIRRNDYGFNVGGPISPPKLYDGRDRSFFFFNFEQFREFFVTNDLNITVPTDAYRRGDFSSALTGKKLGTDPLGRDILEGQIFDPATTRTVGGLLVRDAFPNNIIPTERFDKVAVAVQNLIPAPTSPNVSLNYRPSFPNDRVTSNWSLKLDHQLSANARISGLYLTNWSNAQYSQSLNGSEGLPTPITATRGTFSRSHNWRVNFDYTLSSTKLLHLGAGLLLYQLNDHSPTTDFDDASIGLTGVPNPGGRFPSFAGLCSTGTNGTNAAACTGTGGMMNMGPGVGAAQSLTKQMSPSFQASFTDVRGNHTFKYGSEARIFGFPLLGLTASNGLFNISPNQTAQLSNCPTPATCANVQSPTIGGAFNGFSYASFLLGLVDNGTVNPSASLRTGKHFISFFAQDSWKVTRKLTLDYGLRYDYFTYPREQYGRQPSLSPTVANPTVGGILGGVIYEATCNCSFAKNYAYAFGPRLGLAYQFLPKTVLRLGIGVAYDGTATGATGTAAAAPSNTFRAPGFGAEAMTLSSGVPQAYVLPWPNLSAGAFPNPNFPAIQNGPPNVIDPNAGRPARQVQWSVGVQREIMRDLLVDVAYVGNRGAWWLSSTLVNYNALTPEMLLAKGLDLNNPADLAILRSNISSTQAGRFQNQLPYPGFPTSASVAQSLRPYPQFSTGLTPLWAPIGRTWYDSLQVKATKRVSHGLDVVYAFTWAKELQMGTEGIVAGTTTAVINGVQNRPVNKTLSGFGRPFVSVISANYRLPAWGSNKFLSYAVRDWAIGATLNYSSGLPILAPASTNNLNTLLFQGSTFVNRVPGVSPFLKDLNCHCIDPTKDLVLNPAAWTNPADGQFGTGAPYYNDYRYQRRPSESMSLGRVFKLGGEGTTKALTVRMNFQNIFNRTYMQNPSSTSITTFPTKNPTNGYLTGGFGFINYVGGSTFQPPRQGTLEMRLQF